MIEITNSFDKQQWDEFVRNHPHGNIFQTTDMAEVYRQTKNYDPISLAAIDPDSGEMLAVLQAVIIREMGGLLSSFSARSVIQGGPLVVEGKKGLKAAAKLMEHYDDAVRKKVVYTQIRNMWDTQGIRDTLGSLNYTYDEHLNYLIDLNRTSEEIWRNIHKSRRKGINRAEKSGISIRRMEDPAELDECYSLIEETYKSIKVPLADISLFKAAYGIFAPTGTADHYVAIQDGEPVGTRITLKFNGMVHDWYAGSKRDAAYVDEALVWYILKENAGTQQVFDFGGAGHPEKPYGVREFKRRFGGEEVNYGRYGKVHGESKKRIAEAGFNVYKKFR
jgi:lipid II:glycine glycyltransferase (peptidoglycan interpeptide bridge formation enzyme)